MSPTVFRYKNYRFFFFSREEKRMHIHVFSPDGEAKYWMEPKIELEKNFGFKEAELSEIIKIIEEKKDDISQAWKKHFKS